jgi:hypothetical protein
MTRASDDDVGGSLVRGTLPGEQELNSERNTGASRFITGRRASACTFTFAQPGASDQCLVLANIRAGMPGSAVPFRCCAITDPVATATIGSARQPAKDRAVRWPPSR